VLPVSDNIYEIIIEGGRYGYSKERWGVFKKDIHDF
jgi:hypothetical protein